VHLWDRQLKSRLWWDIQVGLDLELAQPGSIQLGNVVERNASYSLANTQEASIWASYFSTNGFTETISGSTRAKTGGAVRIIW
jgi:hypothetical protein